MRIKGFIILLAIAVMACSAQKGTTQTPEQSTPVLTDGEWVLKSMKGEPISGLKKPITLTIVTETKRVSGYAGCNQFFSSYTIAGSAITFTLPGRTKMFCKETMNMEDQFLEVLNRVRAFKFDGSKLQFTEGDTVLLEFEK